MKLEAFLSWNHDLLVFVGIGGWKGGFGDLGSWGEQA